MPETTCEKVKRHCAPFTYAFTPSHIKSVLVGTVTEYESKLLVLIQSNSFLITFSTEDCYYTLVLNSVNVSICPVTHPILCIRLSYVV